MVIGKPNNKLAKDINWANCLLEDTYFKRLTMNSIINIVGLLALLIAFVLSKVKIVKTDDIYYNILNFTGAFILALYALNQGVWEFVVLEAIWGLVALWGIYEIGKRKKEAKRKHSKVISSFKGY